MYPFKKAINRDTLQFFVPPAALAELVVMAIVPAVFVLPASKYTEMISLYFQKRSPICERKKVC